MSFRLFARGTGGYSHSREYADEGDVYDLGTALSRIGAMGGVARAASQGLRSAGEAAAGAAVGEAGGQIPNSDGGFQAALNTLGSFVAIDALRDSFTLTLARAHSMLIFVDARSPNLILSDDHANFSFRYSVSDRSTAGDFLRDLNPVLEEADLNRFMVISRIAAVLANWNGRRAPRGQCQLNIFVTNT